MRVSESFHTFIFVYEEILHAKKSIKCKQATFTQIFYAHKKHKKQLLLIKSIKQQAL